MMDGFAIYPGTRAQYAPTPGLLNISMDFNAAPSGTARGTEVIIPDNASPEVRAAAQQYNQMVADFARQNGISDYPIRGVRTRSENGRGVPHTIHAEPFFNTDMDMQRAIQANPQAFANIYKTAFGGIPNARLIAPHGVGNDRGAASEIFGDETTFGELIAKAALGEDFTLPEPQGGPQMARQPQPGLLGNPVVSTQGRAPEPKERWWNDDRRDRLVLGLEGMTMNPNRGLMMAASQGLRERAGERKEAKASEKEAGRRKFAVQWLRSKGRDDLAQAVDGGFIDYKTAAA